jgi:hypothetical protein
VDHPSYVGIVKSNPESRYGYNNRLVSIIKSP